MGPPRSRRDAESVVMALGEGLLGTALARGLLYAQIALDPLLAPRCDQAAQPSSPAGAARNGLSQLRPPPPSNQVSICRRSSTARLKRVWLHMVSSFERLGAPMAARQNDGK